MLWMILCLVTLLQIQCFFYQTIYQLRIEGEDHSKWFYNFFSICFIIVHTICFIFLLIKLYISFCLYFLCRFYFFAGVHYAYLSFVHCFHLSIWHSNLLGIVGLELENRVF